MSAEPFTDEEMAALRALLSDAAARREINIRTLRHELETPWRDHDDKCCIDAARGVKR